MQIYLSFLDVGQKGKGRGGELKAVSHQSSKMESFSIMKPFMPMIILRLKSFLFLFYLKEKVPTLQGCCGS